ncbi:MAG TPA: SpoIIE family protein phosphatase [Candidatus Methylomirabilis sp.]|nr:SpoIIE family protein phosphatase [Candidatus Methylomirabilis sp.]
MPPPSLTRARRSWVGPASWIRAWRLSGWLLACTLVLLAFPPSLQAANAIRVGIYPDEPLVFRDAQGLPQGIYIDLLEHMAKEEGWTLQYIEGSWEECLRRLQRAEIDLLTAIGYSVERGRQFDFNGQPVAVNWGQVYVRTDSPIQSLLDLTDRTLAVLRGDIYYESLKSTQGVLKVYPKFIEVDTYLETLQLLAKGKVDGALVPRLFGAFHERQLRIQKSTIMFSPTELRFAAPKGKQRELLAAIDRSLTAMKADKRSDYYRSLNVWIEGVQTLVFPKWLNPLWVVVGVASTGLLIVGMNLLLRQQVRLRTEALRESLAAQARTASELRFARDIQMSFVPKQCPAVPGYEIHGTLQPAREVGGDFYDCFLLDDDHLCILLGDVSGKGVPAALFMAVTKTLLSATALAMDSPAPILTRVNDRLSLNNDASMFVTVFCGILDVPSGRIVYTNAGHNPPAVLRHAGGIELLEAGRSPALGIEEGLEYEVFDAKLDPGDCLFLYTDGVTEAMNGQEEMFSEDRLWAELSAASVGSAKDLAIAVLQKVTAFTGDVPQADDIAVLVLRRQPDRGAES